MNFRWKYAAAVSLIASAPWCASAQMEMITDSAYRDSLSALSDAGKNAKNPYLKGCLGSISKQEKRATVTAVRVAQDLNKTDFAGKVAYYAVPAMSELQRLPDVYPLDGRAISPVRIIMAQDEYEPGSFLVYPFVDLGKVEFKLTDFKTKDGKVFPADKLDLKVVKVWYQNKNGWYSYFADTELKLCPELLLNDEDLIKVDTEKVQNYARLTEKNGKQSYFWLTPPLDLETRLGYPSWSGFHPFQCMKPNFQDAKKLQPVTLKKAEFKQFFLTARAEKNQTPGLYSGSVSMVKDGAQIGSIPVTIKVLPFALPDPCAYGNTDKPFFVSSYSYISFDLILCQNGGDMELAKQQLLEVLADQVRHNQTMHMVRGNANEYEHAFTIETMKKAGMRTDYIMGGCPTARSDNALDRAHDAKMLRKYYMEKVGHTNVFFGFGDEPPASWVVNNRPVFKAYQKEGLKFFIAGGDQVFFTGGYLYDFFNTARNPEDREATRKWNEVDHAWVAWYASQHVGPENPSFNRRQNGLAPYLGNYSALCNYAHHFGPYNDRSETYKPMVLAYGSGSGVIDTIQWEGFREGIDDIRYATYLKRLALKASKSADLDVQYAGREALQFFAELDPASCDQNEARLEMIRHILRLQSMVKK